MNREPWLRRALWLAAFFNVAGAGVFAFPASKLGSLAGLPAAAPAVYRAFTAMFILLFGGAYAWLAQHQPLNRPFVAFGAIGKTSAFVLTLALVLLGLAPFRAAALASGDLAFAALFAWGLAGSR